MARVEVPMPQMGESIAEGTVSKWLKKVGDPVERDEPILEISTDKVDAEIPSPTEGVLAEVAVQEGETVEVGTVVAYIETDAAEAPEGEAAEAVAEAEAPEAREEEAAAEVPEEEAAEPAREPAAAAAVREREARPAAREREPSGDGRPETAEERLRRRSTPLVRRIAAEHGVDLSDVEGTGRAGRVTKRDIMAYLESRERAPARPEAPPPREREAPPREPAVAPSTLWDLFYGEVRHPEFPVGPDDRLEPMDKIRRLTAEHMVLAKRIAPHVHSFIEVDFTRVDAIRRRMRTEREEGGVRVSFTSFVVWACSRVLREFPRVNATISGEDILYRGNINIGIAVDLDPGLIVPVIRHADELSLVGIARKMVDLAERARSRQLKPEEIQGGTFSITNPGVLGTLVGMPIIPKGQAAILGTGAIRKTPVVVTDPDTGGDAIAIRKRALFSLGYDHRIVDGADAARFLARLREVLEDFPEEA